MADNRIQYKDFVDSGQIIQDWETDLKKMEAAVIKSFARIKKEAKGLFTEASDAKKIKSDIEKLKKLMDELAVVKKGQAAINKQVTQSEIKLAAAQKGEAQAVADNRVETSKLNREKQLNAKVNKTQEGSIARLKAETNLMNNKLEQLNLTTKKGKEEAKRYMKQISTNTKVLKKHDAALGRHNRNVGNYASGLKNVGRQLLGAAGVVSGIMLFTQGLRRAINVTKTYNSNMASLSAITGASGKDLIFFAKEAKKSSKSSLQSVNDMVKAFERIGSIRPELLQAKEALVGVTNAAVILSESTGGMLSLEDAANATAGVMNQLGIKSSEALRVINALAAGSLKGSATTLQLSESFKNFGAVADNANVTLEQSVGLVELAATKMLLGSEAGTAIRNSILNLQKANLGYASGQFDVNDAIDEFNEHLGTFGSQAEKDAFLLETFGKKNITFGTILVQNKEKFNDLTEAVTGTTTALEQQEKQNNTLAGSAARLGTAWDSFITGSSGAASFLSSILDGISNQLNDAGGTIRLEVDGEEVLHSISMAEAFQLRMAEMVSYVFGYESDLERFNTKMVANFKATINELEKLSDNQLAVKAAKTKEGLDNIQEIINNAAKSNNTDAADLFSRELKSLKTQTAAIATEFEKRGIIYNSKSGKIEPPPEDGEKPDPVELQVITLGFLNEQIAKLKTNRDLIAVSDNTARIANERLTDELQRQVDLINSMEPSDMSLGFVGPQQEQFRPDSKIPDAGGSAPEQLAFRQADMEIAATQYSEDEKAEIRQAGIDAGLTAYEGLFDFMTSMREREAMDIEKKRDHELQLAGNNVAEQKKINDKYDKEQRAVKRKQAKQGKVKALFDIAIATAVGIAQAIPNPFLIAFAAIIGAIQLAAVAARPLPAYKKGVKSKPESGWSIVNEAGQEGIIHPDGRVELTSGGNKSETRYLEKGTEVIPNKDLQKHLAGMSDVNMRPYNEKVSMRELERLQRQQISEQQSTNELLGRFKYSDGKGRIFDLKGNSIEYV